MRRNFLLLSLLCLFAGIAIAQVFSFEVASIKPSPPNSTRGVTGGCRGIDSVGADADTQPLGRCVISDARLDHIAGIAYGLPVRVAIARMPEWLNGRFNVESKAEDPATTTRAQLHSMLQTLITARFNLKFHREAQEVDGFALVVSGNNLRMKPSTSERSVFSMYGGGPSGSIENAKSNIFRGAGPVTRVVRKATADEIAQYLSTPSQRPVLNKTNLDGQYDFDLNWDESVGPSFVTAVREQLGLRMESQKVQREMLVIDSADPPTPN